MVQLSAVFIGLVALATSTYATPITLEKRIAQVIADSTTKWEQTCLSAGGGEQCNPLSVTAFSTLLAAPGPCAQQDAADQMVDLAKSLKSTELLTLSQIFAQQPRNTPNSVATPYCQQAPQNAELNGLFQCQFQSANQNTFVGGLAVGQPGTIPFGRTSPVSPLGSCPANTSGPIADGSQLTDITSSPGVPGDSGDSTPPSATTKAEETTVRTTSTKAAETTVAATTAAPPAATTTASSGSSTGFALANGQDAQALNKKFASLTADSTCSTGDTACINGGFAQCVGGNFVVSPCSGGLQCFALPLVNSRGTSLTCDTQADAETRIANTGATGGLTGNGAAPAPSTTESAAAPASTAGSDGSATDDAATAPTAPSTPSTGFALANGQAAQKLNKQFASLTASSTCTEGQEACVSGGFAQCVGGKFVVSPCSGGTQCFALPLVNSSGTSLTCDTQADAEARIANTGATGGLTGA